MKQKVYVFGKALLIAGKECAKNLKNLETAFNKLKNITGPLPNYSPYTGPPSSK